VPYIFVMRTHSLLFAVTLALALALSLASVCSGCALRSPSESDGAGSADNAVGPDAKDVAADGSDANDGVADGGVEEDSFVGGEALGNSSIGSGAVGGGAINNDATGSGSNSNNATGSGIAPGGDVRGVTAGTVDGGSVDSDAADEYAADSGIVDRYAVNRGSADSGAGAMGESSITLTVWEIWPEENDANAKSFYESLEKWRTDYPNIEIEIYSTDNEAYKSKIKTAIATGEAPDVFFCWGRGFSQPFAEAGALLAFDEYLTDGTLDKLNPGALVNYTFDGKVYGLPFIMWVGVLYCNTELFDRYGAALPETNDDLLAAVEVFRRNGLTPIAVGAKDGWPAMFYQNIYTLRAAGADACNSALSGGGRFDDPLMTLGVQKLIDLIGARAFDPNALNFSYDDAKYSFLYGEAPMLYQGSWFAGEIQDSRESKVYDKVVALNWPSLPDGIGDQNDILGGAIDCFMVSSKTKFKEESVAFVKYITQNMSKRSFEFGAGISPWKIDISDIETSPLVKQIIDISASSESSVLAWDTSLSGKAADELKILSQRIFAGQITAQEFVGQMQKQAQQQ